MTDMSQEWFDADSEWFEIDPFLIDDVIDAILEDMEMGGYFD